MTPSSEGDAYPALSQNFKRGLGLLHLATEQIRLFDQETANVIRKDYLDPVDFWFKQAIQNPDYQNILRDGDARQRLAQYQRAADAAWDKIKPSMPITPPGLGYEALGLEEASPTTRLGGEGLSAKAYSTNAVSMREELRASSRPWASNDHMQSALPKSASFSSASPAGLSIQASPETTPKQQNFGAIGSRKTSKYPRYQSRADSGWGSFEDGLLPSTPVPKLRDSGSGIGQGLLPGKLSRDLSEPVTYLQNTMQQGIEQRRANQLTPPQTAQDFEEAVKAYALANKDELLDLLLPQKPKSRSSHSQDIAYNNKKFFKDQGNTYDSEWPSANERFQAREEIRVGSTSANGPRGSNINSSEQGGSDEAPPAPAPSTWAKIAAIPADASCATTNITIPLSSKPGTTAHRKGASRAQTIPSEPSTDQQRVVWLAHLPSAFTCRDVSVQITQGPIMSIYLQRDAHESLPGVSACIIFQHAADASTFLADNGFSLRGNVYIGPTTYAIPNVANGKRVPAGADAILPIPGSPYALDEHLISMGPPTYARRRIKLSRSRLFYDVSMRGFKRDILEVVGGADNVELFHFYNPGECTIVFSSVGVAAVALAALEGWRGERLPEGRAFSAKEDERAVVVGALDGVRGRYAGIDVGFVRDFNEAPARLWSQYGRDGKLRSSSRMEGCEGVFEGPSV